MIEFSTELVHFQREGDYKIIIKKEMINMDKVRIGQIMFDLFDSYEDCDEIIDSLRSLNSEGEITDEEYDYCLEHWDEILLDWESQI